MMPQEFRVVQCYNCKAFQVDIIKKVPKWSCKICGEKQSIKKIYCNGSAKECRLYVQDLNEKRIRFETEEVPSECHLENKAQGEQLLTNEEKGSKWLEFIQNTENNEEIICDETEKSSVNKSNEATLVNCNGKRELEINNLSCKQFKPNSNVKKIGVPSKNIFDSENDHDIDSLLDI